jgi:hypothetical protein
MGRSYQNVTFTPFELDGLDPAEPGQLALAKLIYPRAFNCGGYQLNGVVSLSYSCRGLAELTLSDNERVRP